jgi:hypothetical protein
MKKLKKEVKKKEVKKVLKNAPTLEEWWNDEIKNNGVIKEEKK